jgi:hypothetical protein
VNAHPTVELRRRARRILTDGLKHSEQAYEWARSMVPESAFWLLKTEWGFTPEEIRLGMTEVVR